VTINDSMVQVLWTRHFFAAQGQYVPTTTIYQDNKSTILLAENGKTSSSRRRWLQGVRYFFVIQKGEVKFAFCPMHEMIGEFFTKPLQGALFTWMLEKVLNLPKVQAIPCTGVCWNIKNMVVKK